MEPWTLKYRPRRLDDIVGQGHIKPVLRAMTSQQSPHPAMIFAGSRGTGKTTAARILAAALNCEVQDGDACTTCSRCQSVARSNSTSVLEVDAASSGGVDNVRQIKEICAYAHEGEWRIILLDEAHSMSRDAFNALLKTLEEPPSQTVFVLLTTEVEKILPTIRSRSMTFDFRRLSPENLESRLAYVASQETVQAAPELLAEIAVRSDGGMRDAIMMLEQVSRVGVTTVDDFRELFGLRDVSLQLIASGLDGDLATGFKLVEEQFYRSGDARSLVADLSRTSRDLLVLKAGGDIHGSQSYVEERQALANRIETKRLLAMVKILWSLQDKVRVASEDQRSTMDIAFAMIAESLGRPQEPIQTVEARQTTMSLRDMRAAMRR